MKTIACLLITLILIGCGGPTVRAIVVDGNEMTEHLDVYPNPCGPSEGCYQRKDGKHHVFYKSESPLWVRIHEQCHALGMRHTAWHKDWAGSARAAVTAAACHYKVGQVIHSYTVSGVLREEIAP